MRLRPRLRSRQTYSTTSRWSTSKSQARPLQSWRGPRSRRQRRSCPRRNSTTRPRPKSRPFPLSSCPTSPMGRAPLPPARGSLSPRPARVPSSPFRQTTCTTMSGARAATSLACACTPPGPSRSARRVARCTGSWWITPTRPTAWSTRRTRAATARSTPPSSSAAASLRPTMTIRTSPFPSSTPRAPPTCKRFSLPRSRPATTTTRCPR
mmetsp:Transcript_8831/g.21850  ORF Transcript_8831/g.21850 Transcript_8831/m.21850 type:complete len:209 (+) Transcript_8831:722-1348(+)